MSFGGCGLKLHTAGNWYGHPVDHIHASLGRHSVSVVPGLLPPLILDAFGHLWFVDKHLWVSSLDVWWFFEFLALLSLFGLFVRVKLGKTLNVMPPFGCNEEAPHLGWLGSGPNWSSCCFMVMGGHVWP